MTQAWLERRLPPVEMLDEEGYAQIEENAEIILEEVGIAFQEFPSALELWKDAGAEVRGEMVHFPRGLCRRIVQDNAPKVMAWLQSSGAASVGLVTEEPVKQ